MGILWGSRRRVQRSCAGEGGLPSTGRDFDPNRRLDLWLLYTLGGLLNTGTMTLAVLVPLVGLHLGLGPQAVGMLVALPGVPLVGLRVWGGRAADRWGPRSVLVVGTASFLFGAGVLRLWPGLPGMVLAQLLTGAGRAVYLPAMQFRLYGHAGTRVVARVALFNASAGVGASAGAVLGGEGVGLGGVAGATALVGVATAMLVAAILLSSDAEGRAGAAAPAAGLRRTIARLWLPGLLTVVSTVPFVLASSLYPIYGRMVGLSGGEIGRVVAVRGLATVAAGLGFVALCRAVGRRALRWAALGLLACGVACSPLVRSGALLAMMLFMASAGGVWLFSEASVLVSEIADGATGQGYALVGTAWSLGLLVLPALLGAVAAGLGVPSAFWVTGAIAMGAVGAVALG